jgi:hypothetical protein
MRRTSAMGRPSGAGPRQSVLASLDRAYMENSMKLNGQKAQIPDNMNFKRTSMAQAPNRSSVFSRENTNEDDKETQIQNMINKRINQVQIQGTKNSMLKG